MPPQSPSPAISAAARAYQRRHIVRDILKLVAETTGVETMAALRGPSQRHDITGPRHIAMWLCRRLTNFSTVKIGREFRRHHTTALYGIAAVDRARLMDPDVKAMTDDLLAKLNGKGQQKLPLGG